MHYEIGYAHIEDWVLVVLLLNFKFYLFSLETGSCCTAQAGPELPMETNPISNQSRFPHICLSNPGVTGMCHPGIKHLSFKNKAIRRTFHDAGNGAYFTVPWSSH